MDGLCQGLGTAQCRAHVCPGHAQLPELQPDVVGGVSADHRCLTHSSLLHPKLRGKMSFPPVVPSTDLLCVGSAPLFYRFSAFSPIPAADSPFQSSPKVAQLFRSGAEYLSWFIFLLHLSRHDLSPSGAVPCPPSALLFLLSQGQVPSQES